MRHPTIRLLTWGAVAGLTQTLDGLALIATASAWIALSIVAAPAMLRTLAWRARWLLVSIAVLFCCATPGELLLPWLGGLSPTSQGIQLAGDHVARLVALLALLSVLLRFTPPAALISGFYGVLRPLKSLGISRERLALRLMLVMRYVEVREHLNRPLNWRQRLSVPDSIPNEDSCFTIEVLRLGLLDFATLVALVAVATLLATA